MRTGAPICPAGLALLAAVEAEFARGAQRVETLLSPHDEVGLALATVAGLRREGVLRGAGPDGADVVLLARLAADLDPRENLLPTLSGSFHRMLVACGLLVRNTAGDVLLLETSYKTQWEIPGGLAESGEDPLAVAHRETLEELGVELPVGELLCVDMCPANTLRPDLLALVFDAGVHPPSLRQRLHFADGEILAAHWCDEERVRRHCTEVLAGRVGALMDTAAPGRGAGPLLLRDGRRAR